jgi:hypothetical protein
MPAENQHKNYPGKHGDDSLRHNHNIKTGLDCLITYPYPWCSRVTDCRHLLITACWLEETKKQRIAWQSTGSPCFPGKQRDICLRIFVPMDNRISPYNPMRSPNAPRIINPTSKLVILALFQSQILVKLFIILKILQPSFPQFFQGIFEMFRLMVFQTTIEITG